jgi:hypothetical protein
MTPTNRKTADRIYQYVDLVQLMQDNHWKAMNFTFSPPPMVGVTFGSRYAKVIKQDRHYLNKVDGFRTGTDDPDKGDVQYGGQSVHSFVDLATGDILKGSWKAPVKNGVRGNIFEDDLGADRINEHGPVYLRGPAYCKRHGLIRNSKS